MTIRFRTGRNNIDIVWLCTDCEHYKMKKTESDREFDYYAVELTMGEEPSCTRFLWIVFTMVIRLTMC